MLHFDRSRARLEVANGAGNPHVLVAEQLSFRVGSVGFGVGASYRRAVGVEGDGSITPITDVVMVVRLAGMLAVILAMIVGVIRR